MKKSSFFSKKKKICHVWSTFVNKTPIVVPNAYPMTPQNVAAKTSALLSSSLHSFILDANAAAVAGPPIAAFDAMTICCSVNWQLLHLFSKKELKKVNAI